MELPKTYEPEAVQQDITQRWLKADAFAAAPDARGADQRYVIMMPLPNITGALHMGHAIDNVLQDLLIRWQRMRGKNTLWQPGTDHAGIATQAVVEKRLFELEGKTRHDIGREALVERIWSWKEEFQQRIITQQQQMGCSCDWQRQRFTVDAVCTAAVREVFFRLFSDRLIYQGARLVNWDCQLQTAVSDDEVYHEPVPSHFWHLRYPVIDPQPGEPDDVVVATTRPETMLGDTAVACHPDPRAALQQRIEAQRTKLNEATDKDRPTTQAELDRLQDRMTHVIDRLETLARMARDGRQVMLPLMERPIPLILDSWAKPELGSGCVKITPAHDPNDYDVWGRHQGEIGIVNILKPDGTLNENAGQYAGQDRFAARKAVVADLERTGRIEAIEDREVEIGHSDRSKTPIEPFLSKQWFVRMGDREGGICCGRGTAREFQSAGLAQVALDAVRPDWSSPGGRRLQFHPERYVNGYVAWLGEKRDWCISRQLWWGHRIPVWTRTFNSVDEALVVAKDTALAGAADVQLWIADEDGRQYAAEDLSGAADPARLGRVAVQVCLRNNAADGKWKDRLAELGLVQDPDVLDTWFSSALWPFSTLGWPNPEQAPIESGQRPLGSRDGAPNAFDFYYPGSCLVTARDIITLWVARMLILGLYTHGEVPFTDCFVHAKILDGKGVTMSKSKGNGIDPVDIIKQYGVDAMRYLLCDMETGMQDVRLPVQATCPACSTLVELTEAKHGRTIFTYLCTSCEKEFDVLGTMAGVPSAKVTSDRFEVGKNFCNKLWNAARFALMNVGELSFAPLSRDDLAAEDRWILSRLNRVIEETTRHLGEYHPSAALNGVRNFFWGELCDWYLELIKARLREGQHAQPARQVLAVCLDQVLRLLHPFLPFITEALWGFLRAQVPSRGIETELPDAALCIRAAWPEARPEWHDPAIEAELEQVRQVIGCLRELRARHDVPPKKQLPAAIRAQGGMLRTLQQHAPLIIDQARLSGLELDAAAQPPPNAATHLAGEAEVFLGEVLDPVKERERLTVKKGKLEKQLTASQKKLANPGFLQKAPPDVVATEQKKVAELEGQLAMLAKNLSALENAG